jgi:DNA-binding NarL/FixJ family response regulator
MNYFDTTMEETTVKIIIVEDNDIIREGFELLINSMKNYNVLETFSSCEDAIKKATKLEPDVILMDIELPGMNGIEGTKKLKDILPKSDIIVITIHDNADLVFQALCAGASGYMTKNTDHSKLLDAIDEVIRGGAPMSTNIARMVVESFQINRNSPLSERETQVLELLSKGKSYTVIANELFIHKETVKSHIKNIYFKLQVHSKAEAIEKAQKNKFIS